MADNPKSRWLTAHLGQAELDIADLQTADAASVHTNVAGEIAAVTEKVSPVGADVVLIEDSAAGNAKKRVQVSAIVGMAGGGGDEVSINTNPATDVDLSDSTPAAPAGDLNIAWQSTGSSPTNVSGYVDTSALEPLLGHDNLAGFATNEHVDHTLVSVLAGIGLTGGGTIASSRTLDIDWVGLTNHPGVLAADDLLAVFDAAPGADYRKVTFSQLEGDLTHNNLGGVTAAEHVDHSGVSFTGASNFGIGGGGTIESSRTLKVSISNSVLASPSSVSADYVLTETPGGVLQHEAKSSFLSDVAAAATTVTAGVGLSGGGSLASNITIDLDLTELASSATADDADEIIIFDADAVGHRRQTRQKFIAGFDHGSLGDLTADDHTQYALANGSRTFSGDVTIDGSYDLAVHDIVEAVLNNGVRVEGVPFRDGVIAVAADTPVISDSIYFDDGGAEINKVTAQNFFRLLVGTSFPGSPSDGDIFVRTDLENTVFTYDSTNTVWLGPEIIFEFGTSGTGLNNQYLRRGGNATTTSGNGYPAPYDIAIVGLSGSWTTAVTSGTFEVRTGGTLISGALHTVSSSQTKFTTRGLYATVSSGSTLEAYLNTLSSAIGQPSMTIYARRRAT